MSRRVLITGGAGFIGSHLAEELIAYGYRVRVLDALVPQVHGPERARPSYLAREVDLVVGDIRDPDAIAKALSGVDIVYHLAARIGVAQSMYELSEYTSVNNLGTARLLECLIAHPVQRLVVASSMNVYGEGLYRDATEQIHDRVQRTAEQLAHGDWEPKVRGQTLSPVPTPETKRPAPASVYALSNYDQEQMCLMVGAAYRIPTIALRLFDVYGPRQALSNPYAGALASFASRLLNERAPVVFEDGNQRRDFVHVRDVATAFRLALENGDGGVFNIGTGQAVTVAEAATRLASVLHSDIAPEIAGQYRAGDIRHCIADIGLARRVLGYRPAIGFDKGLADLAAWLASQHAVDRVDQMRADLAQRGLTL